MDKACCALPPVSAEYTPKGYYETIAGLKTCKLIISRLPVVIFSHSSNPPSDVVKPPCTPQRAIIEVYDVFGLAPQTIQGADRLSAATNSVVLIPDWFKGDYCKASWFGPSATAEDKAALDGFVQRQVRLDATVEKLVEVRKEVGEKWPEVEGHVGVFGLCFGGKIAVLAAGDGNEGTGRKFSVSGTAHPRYVSAALMD